MITATICSWICGTGTSTICFPTRFCTRSHGTCCTPSKICGTRSATICSTTICSRLVTGHGTRGTQHHNVCCDVHGAPYESHDNLSEDVADASNQPHSQVDRSEKSDCLARFARFTKGVPATARRQQRVEAQVDQVHHTHLITASKDNVPTLIRVNKTCQERLTENRHMSMRIVANVQLECKRPRQLSEVLFNVPVPQNLEKTAGLTHLARHNIKNNSGQAPATLDEFSVSATSPSSHAEA